MFVQRRTIWLVPDTRRRSSLRLSVAMRARSLASSAAAVWMLISALSIGVFSGIAPAARAGQPGEQEMVFSQPSLFQNPTLGAFVATTRIGAGAIYDSNIFGRRTDLVSDRIDFVTPGLAIASRWARHSLTADLELNYRSYNDIDVEALDFVGRVNGVLNINRSFDLGADFARSHFHSLRVDATTDVFVTTPMIPRFFPFDNRDLPANIAGLIPVTQQSESVWLRYNAPRLTNTLTLARNTSEYGSVTTTDSGQPTTLNNHNSEIVRLENRTELRLSHRLRTVVSAYETTRTQPDAPQRNSTTVGIINGWELIVAPLVSTDVTVAYAQEDFQSPLFDAAPSRSTTAGVSWVPRRNVRLRFSGTQAEEGINFEQASTSSKVSSVLGQLDYEFARYWAFRASAIYSHAIREINVNETRIDNDHQLRFDLSYNFWRNAYINLIHEQRVSQSSDTPFDLEQQITRVEVRARF